MEAKVNDQKEIIDQLRQENEVVMWLTRVVECNNRLEAEDILNKFDKLEKEYKEH